MIHIKNTIKQVVWDIDNLNYTMEDLLLHKHAKSLLEVINAQQETITKISKNLSNARKTCKQQQRAIDGLNNQVSIQRRIAQDAWRERHDLMKEQNKKQEQLKSLLSVKEQLILIEQSSARDKQISDLRHDLDFLLERIHNELGLNDEEK